MDGPDNKNLTRQKIVEKYLHRVSYRVGGALESPPPPPPELKVRDVIITKTVMILLPIYK